MFYRHSTNLRPLVSTCLTTVVYHAISLLCLARHTQRATPEHTRYCSQASETTLPVWATSLISFDLTDTTTLKGMIAWYQAELKSGMPCVWLGERWTVTLEATGANYRYVGGDCRPWLLHRKRLDRITVTLEEIRVDFVTLEAIWVEAPLMTWTHVSIMENLCMPWWGLKTEVNVTAHFVSRLLPIQLCLWRTALLS